MSKIQSPTCIVWYRQKRLEVGNGRFCYVCICTISSFDAIYSYVFWLTKWAVETRINEYHSKCFVVAMSSIIAFVIFIFSVQWVTWIFLLISDCSTWLIQCYSFLYISNSSLVSLHFWKFCDIICKYSWQVAEKWIWFEIKRAIYVLLCLYICSSCSSAPC